MAGLEVFGRERELADLRAFLCGRQHTGALLLTGAVGIGKTALWSAGLALAEQGGRFVMAARPSGAETGMAFAGLIDLCDDVGQDPIAALPAPQRIRTRHADARWSTAYRFAIEIGAFTESFINR